MTGDDELRQRIARVDPLAGGVPTRAVQSARTRALLEHIMSDEITPEPPRSETEPIGRGSRRPILLAAAAAALLLVGVVAVLTAGDDDDGGELVAVDTATDTADDAPEPGDTATASGDTATGDTATGDTTTAAPGEVVELSTGETDPLMMSCLAITPEAG
jgi:hypothetical protein